MKAKFYTGNFFRTQCRMRDLRGKIYRLLKRYKLQKTKKKKKKKKSKT